ncbi:hypothetical protein PMAYCL1PPCAC_12295, partial [Pristionchus mayeri]
SMSSDGAGDADEILREELRDDYPNMNSLIYWVLKFQGAKWAVFIQTNCLPATDAYASLCSAAVGGALRVVAQKDLFPVELETVRTGVKEKKINLLSDRAAFALLRRLDDFWTTIIRHEVRHALVFSIRKEPEYNVILLTFDFHNQGRKNVVTKHPSRDAGSN